MRRQTHRQLKLDALTNTPAEAARRCGVTQSRMNDLLRDRINRFSLDALVNMATTAGLRIEMRVLEAA